MSASPKTVDIKGLNRALPVNPEGLYAELPPQAQQILSTDSARVVEVKRRKQFVVEASIPRKQAGCLLLGVSGDQEVR